ncbi:probable 5-hydroxyisourate hydrolase R09H10.3 isoform X2 [Periplaneta americana]|uniref:probable 5-hydroxyisourate hydrolase R09H10.3 isoform X2 n=1 Tax=Periplaneta americana TaxID=6978 RepID=UPI0037E9354A
MEEPPMKKNTVRYLQFYNDDWEKLPIFKEWLAPVPDNKNKAFCKYCRKQFRAHRTDLRTHARSRKHQRAGDAYASSSTNKDTTQNNSENNSEPEPVEDAMKDETQDDRSWEAMEECMQLMGAESQKADYGGVSTQVLDLVRGVPVSRLTVTLLKENGSTWVQLSEGVTDADGRCSNLLKTNEVVAGRYKMHFEVKKYFTLGLHDTFYPFVEVTFDVTDPVEQYHVPLLLSPFGYMVYRGR